MPASQSDRTPASKGLGEPQTYSPANIWAFVPGTPTPDWLLASVVGADDPGEDLILNTADGEVKIEEGGIVFLHEGKIYAAPAGEASAKIASLFGTPPKRGITPRRPITPKKAAAAPANAKRRKTQRKTKLPPLTFYPVVGMPPSIELRPPTELKVDDSYQRSIENGPSQKLIRHMASRWDWRLCVPLMVSRRPEGLFVIDGQHRLAAARLRKDVPYLPCCINTYESLADEAAMFVAANRARRTMGRLDDFHAAIVGEDPDTLAINKLVTDAGLKVARNIGKQSWTPGEVAFTSAIRTIFLKHGEPPVKFALWLMAEAFKGQVLTIGASMFTALARLRINQPDHLDSIPAGPEYEAAARQFKMNMLLILKSKPMSEWAKPLLGAKGGQEREMIMRRELLAAYAKGV